MPETAPQTIAVEIEEQGDDPFGYWSFQTALDDYTGTGYYQWEGQNEYWLHEPHRQGVLSYIFEIPEGAEDNYRFGFRARRPTDPGGATDLNNDVWVRMVNDETEERVQPSVGSESSQEWWKLFFFGNSSFEEWVWAQALDAEGGGTYSSVWNFPAGRYRVEIAGRSEKVYMDRWALSRGTSLDTATAESMTTPSDGTQTLGVPDFEPSEDYVLAQPGEIYLIYGADQYAESALDMTGHAGTYDIFWYNTVRGELLQGSTTSIEGDGIRPLGEPPSAGGEWAIVVRRR
ncbi:MAG: hypothetical protein AAFX99_26100 [Myxococcota bacterium]